MAKQVSATGSVVIERPPVDVFAFFADAENDPVWRPAVRSIHRVGEPGVGAVYEQTVAGPGGRGVSANLRVVAFEPQRRVGFEATSGPVRPRGEYTFEPVADGTRVTFGLQASLSWPTSWLMAGAVQKSMDAEVAALARAKAHLEA